MNNVTLINPQKKMGYSGVYLDLWSGYDISLAKFTNDGDTYTICFHDGSRRKMTGTYTKENYEEIYQNFIERGWKPVNLI